MDFRFGYMRCRLTVVLSISALAVLLAGRVGECSAQETPLKERFLAEALGAIEEYQKYCRRLQGTRILTMEIQFEKGKKERQRSRFEYKQNLQCLSFLNEYESLNKKWKKLAAVNPDYSFALKRAESGDSWIVTTIDAPDAHAEQGSQYLSESILKGIMPQYYLEECPLADMLRSPEFVLQRVDPVARDGRALARITFQYRQKKTFTDPGYCVVQGGNMLLDPGHYWRPLERNLDCRRPTGTGGVKEQFEYDEGSKGFYVIKRRHETTWEAPLTPDNPDINAVSEYDLREPSRLPSNSEFTLSAYGLPEPPHLRRPTPWYLWAFGAGAVCLILGFFVYRRTRRA